MFFNYSLKSSLSHLSVFIEKHSEKKPKTNGFILMVLMLLFAFTGIHAQTQRIPAGDGNFTNGSTFAANGWTVANEGVSPVKWAVGTAASGTSSVGSVTAASASVTLTAPNANIVVGQIVYGSGIPTNTFVSAIVGTTLTLSQPATITTASATLGFGVFSGGISVGIAQLTTASITSGSYSITLAASPNPNISVGMAIAPIAGIIAPNTFVASINGTALGLSQATIGPAASAQTLTFAATTSAISGNAAYISNDNGATNSYGGYPTNRTVYFYRDITSIPSTEKAMTLTFDVKSSPASGGGWQVFVAPTSQTVTGTDTQVTLPFTYPTGTNPIWAGATLISFNSNPQVATTRTTAFIPKSFAGTSFRLIFVWTNGTSAGTLPPAAIDNISLTSRTPEEITCAQSGLWSQTTTWDGGKVPTPADVVVLDGTETVMIDSRYSGAEDLILAGTNSLLQFALSSVMDEFTIANDLNIAGGGARFNNHDGTNGKYLKLGHNLDVASGARFDSNIGGSTAFQGRLTLNGSTVQTVTIDPAAFVGGSAAGTNAFANVANVISQLEVTNTSTASPNVIWDANGIRIKSSITLTTSRMSITAGKRLILGNFSSLNNITCPVGSGIMNGTISRWTSSGATGSSVITPGTEYPNTDVGFKSYWFPFVSGAKMNRSLYLFPDSNPTTAGEVAITYTDASATTTGLSVADGSYTINNRHDANWSFSTPDGNAIPAGAAVVYTNAAATFKLAVHAPGAYEAKDGSSRLMNQTGALAGTHQEGSSLPFAVRNGLSLANLTAGPIYVGISDASRVNTTSAITSQATGSWDTASTWVGGVVPTCSDNVIIASGHTVTVSSTANTAGVVINAGGTLVNNGGTMTVGCTNNNAAFYNYGTHTMTSGNLVINGFMSQKVNSFFNQTGGDIIIDSNNNGDAATSVALGGASCKIETGNLALTGGKITIVDPLVNQSAPINVTTSSSLNLNTAGASGTFTMTTSAAATSGQNTIVMSNPNYFYVGQTVTGTGIPAGTTVVTVTPGTIGFTPPTTLVLSNNLSGAITSGATLTFSAMSNGGSSVVLEGNASNSNLSVGQGVSGTGIQAGTTITSITTVPVPGNIYKLNLSLPVLGLSVSPIDAQQTLSFATVTVGGSSVILPAANTSLSNGMPVSGTGLLPGTFIAAVNGAQVSFSSPVQAGAPTPLVFDVYPDTSISSGSFVYSGPNYAAGLNHTLQIGDGISTQKGAIVTNGFNCVFWSSNGMFSLGNLTIDAPDGENRFMSTTNFGTNTALGTMNVQNQLSITAGSTLKKLNGNNTYYVGGNIVNNGSFLQPTASSPLYLGNFINQVAAPTTLAQTLSGTGIWSNNQYSLTSNSPTGSISSLTVNNTNPAGVTLQVPNFRAVLGVALTNGILYTSAAYPLYCGVADVTGPFFGGSFSFSTNVTGSATCHIDGPIAHANKSDASITQNRLFPTGKNGKYLPISISSTGGVELMVEAFDTNSGTTNPVNASGLSANRWRVSRVGTAGTFTGYNVRLGSLTSPVTASSLIVHSADENGTYDIVSTPASAITYDAAHFSLTNLPTIALTTAQTGGLLGNFSYANGPGCSGTPAPGATVASSATACSGQPITLSLTTATTGAGVTYQWQNSTDAGSSWTTITGATAATYAATSSVDTSYRCNVTCASSTGTSTPVAVAVSQSIATGTGDTICVSGVANLTSSGSSILNWYDAPTGGNLVASGTAYSPNVSATTTYYVSSASASASSVNSATYAGTSAVSSALFSGIAFDVTNSVKLKTVTVYPKNTAVVRAPITIGLFDSTGSIVSGTTPVSFVPTLNTGTPNLVSQVVTLNYTIPAGTGYRLVVTNGLITNNTLGNSTATITYPTGSTIKLTGNVTNLSGAVVTTANTTSCFHNLTFDEICESTTRTPVIATVGCTKNLKLFIEGYYDGSSTMKPVKNNQDFTSPTTDVDDVTVELRNDTAPYAVAATTTAVLKTDGSVAAKFNAFPAGNYFIAVKHRNAIETWSAAAQPFGVSTATYDFSTDANKAYGDNMKMLGTGVYGFYSGDINEDGFIEGADFPILINASDDFLEGSQKTDLNGDGFVDGADFPFLINNSDNFIETLHP